MAAGDRSAGDGGGGSGCGGSGAGQVHVQALTHSQVAERTAAFYPLLSIYLALLFLFSQPLQVILLAVAIYTPLSSDSRH